MSGTYWGHADHDRDQRKHEHADIEIMKRYVQGRLTEPERERIDRQLMDCGVCLELFMTVNGSEEAGSPPDMMRLEQRVMSQLMSERRPETVRKRAYEQPVVVTQTRSSRRGSWLQHPAVHYTIAASITLLLLGSGTFAAFSQRMAALDVRESLEQPPASSTPMAEQRISWSDKMVDQTGSWLDSLQAKRFK